MKRWIDSTRHPAFLAGLVAILSGSLLEGNDIVCGRWVVAAGMGFLLVSQVGALPAWVRPIDRRQRRAETPVVIVMLAAALAGGAWSCLSHLGGLAGLHYDVAEFGMLLDGLLQVIKVSRGDVLMRAVMERPYDAMVAMVTDRFGFGLLQIRIIGALVCFITVPCLILLMRNLFDTTTAAFAGLLFSASLWNFTLSKVATWDAIVPFLAVLALLCAAIIMRSRPGLAAIPLLVAVLLFGLNVYEAFRLIFPVLAFMVICPGFLGRESRWRALLAVPSAMAVALLVQWRCVDLLFWERILTSKLVQTGPKRNYLEYADNLLGKLFHGTYDIYLSQSQGGLDHPLMVGLSIAGFCLLLVNLHRRQAAFLAVWTVVPVIFAWVFEGQWRRASVGMPALYCLAAMPMIVWSGYLRALFARVRGMTETRAARLAILAPAACCLALAGFNLARFTDVQNGRWGGYYISSSELAAATTGAEMCADRQVCVFAETHAPLWNFIQKLRGGDGHCFTYDDNLVIPIDSDQAARVHGMIDELLSVPNGNWAVFVQNSPRYEPFAARLEAAATSAPARIRRRTFGGVTPPDATQPDVVKRYVLFIADGDQEATVPPRTEDGAEQHAR